MNDKTNMKNFEKAADEFDWNAISDRLGDKKVIDLFIKYLDKEGYNLSILEAIRKLLK